MNLLKDLWAHFQVVESDWQAQPTIQLAHLNFRPYLQYPHNKRVFPDLSHFEECLDGLGKFLY